MKSTPENLETENEVLRLHHEELVVGRQLRETGEVRIEIRTEHASETVDELLNRTTVSVEHVPFGTIIDAVPSVRHEGNVMIVPVVEEVLVKRLRLVEEIRLTQVGSNYRHQEIVDLRREVATVSRSDIGDTDTSNRKPNEDNHGQ